MRGEKCGIICRVRSLEATNPSARVDVLGARGAGVFQGVSLGPQCDYCLCSRLRGALDESAALGLIVRDEFRV